MDDLISRQAAIDEIKRWIGYIDEDMILRIKTGLKKLPSAQPKRGRWQMVFHTWFCCNCGMNPTKGMGYVQSKNELYPYCPNCGARMEAEE